MPLWHIAAGLCTTILLPLTQGIVTMLAVTLMCSPIGSGKKQLGEGLFWSAGWHPTRFSGGICCGGIWLGAALDWQIRKGARVLRKQRDASARLSADR